MWASLPQLRDQGGDNGALIVIAAFCVKIKERHCTEGWITNRIEVSSGSVSEGGLSSPDSEKGPRGLTTRLNVVPAWLNKPNMLVGGQVEKEIITFSADQERTK